jgi:hypothetical protein
MSRLLEDLPTRRLEGMNAVGAKADTEAAPKARTQDSFMVKNCVVEAYCVTDLDLFENDMRTYTL